MKYNHDTSTYYIYLHLKSARQFKLQTTAFDLFADGENVYKEQ